MRGGLDDALDKLARRDELRRRAASEATGTSPAVTELVEAIAGVVARHPELGVTVGAEGSGDPVLLHFYYAEGQVQVTADNPVPPASAVPAARHADIVDVDLDEPVVEDPYGPAHHAYGDPTAPESYFADSDTAERRYGSFDSPPPATDARYPAHDPGETSRDLGARMRDLGLASRGPATPGPASGAPASSGAFSAGAASGAHFSGGPLSGGPVTGSPVTGSPASGAPFSGGPVTGSPVSGGPFSTGPDPAYPPHPFAATPPPPVPPQTSAEMQTHRIRAEQHREPAATERLVPPRGGAMPTPLPKPIPLQVERPEETEMAARRLAALLRDDPSLLNNSRD